MVLSTTMDVSLKSGDEYDFMNCIETIDIQRDRNGAPWQSFAVDFGNSTCSEGDHTGMLVIDYESHPSVLPSVRLILAIVIGSDGELYDVSVTR